MSLPPRPSPPTRPPLPPPPARRPDRPGRCPCLWSWRPGRRTRRLLQRELARQGELLSINRMLEELGGIRETLVVYPRRPGQRQFPTATCLTHMNPIQQRLFSLLD